MKFNASEYVDAGRFHPAWAVVHASPGIRTLYFDSLTEALVYWHNHVNANRTAGRSNVYSREANHLHWTNVTPRTKP